MQQKVNNTGKRAKKENMALVQILPDQILFPSAFHSIKWKDNSSSSPPPPPIVVPKVTGNFTDQREFVCVEGE